MWVYLLICWVNWRRECWVVIKKMVMGRWDIDKKNGQWVWEETFGNLAKKQGQGYAEDRRSPHATKIMSDSSQEGEIKWHRAVLKDRLCFRCLCSQVNSGEEMMNFFFSVFGSISGNSNSIAAAFQTTSHSKTLLPAFKCCCSHLGLSWIIE